MSILLYWEPWKSVFCWLLNNCSLPLAQKLGYTSFLTHMWGQPPNVQQKLQRRTWRVMDSIYCHISVFTSVPSHFIYVPLLRYDEGQKMVLWDWTIITPVSNVCGTKKGREELILLKCSDTWLLISRPNVPFFCCAVRRARTPSAPRSALQPQSTDKYSPQANLYTFPFHQPREISARPLVKPRLSAPSPTLWIKEVSPDLKLQGVQHSFWTGASGKPPELVGNISAPHHFQQ